MKSREIGWTLAVALLMCGTVAFAQDQKQDQSPIDPNAPLQPLDSNPVGNTNRPPVPAGRGIDPDMQPYDPAQVTPDQHTLAGAAPITLGSLQHNRNTFDPSVSVSQVGETIPTTTGSTDLVGVTVVGGGLNFNRTWSQYHLVARYNGGETFNFGFGGLGAASGVTSPHFQFHNLLLSQEIDGGRWHGVIEDSFAASPGATFTGQGVGGPGLLGTNASTSFAGLGQTFTPAETVNTGDTMRIENSVIAQLEYALNRRSAFTVSGGYGLLHFNGGGYLSSTMVNGQVGYDYALSPFDSIAILASYGKISYSGNGTSTTGSGVSTVDYLGALAYGRKITGRLAFQVAAGPQEIVSSGTGVTTGHSRIWFVSVNSALNYAWRRSGVSFAYVRGLTAGSGVFLGATSNTFSFTGHYQFTRFWTGTVAGGYSLNNTLPTEGVAPAQFDNWFVSGNIGRRLGYHAVVNFNYGLTKQNSPTPCPVLNCGVAGFQQTFGVSFGWHLRPAG